MTWEPWAENPLEPEMGLHPSFVPVWEAYLRLSKLLSAYPEAEAVERLGDAISGLEHKFAPHEPPAVTALEAMTDAMERKFAEVTARLEALDGLARRPEAEDDVPEDDYDLLAESIDFEGFGDYFPADWGEGGEDE